MQLTIERSALLKALGHVQSVVERRNTIPILSNVLLSAGRDKLSFAATDLDMEMVDEAEATVQVEGQITAPAHTLYEIVRKLPDGEDLARLIDKTRFAVSTEETRYYLNGLYLHTVAEGGIPLLRAVATDGHRLALAETPAPEGAAGGPGVIVPRKTVDQVRRLLDDGSGPVEVQVSPQKIRFEFGQASLTSKVIDGAFPDYMRVIPKGNDKQADIDNAVFASAVDRVATISAEKSRSVKLAFELDRVTLTVRNMEAGQGVEEVEIGYSEDPFEIGFNARYLLDVAGQITGENATFMFADPASPTLVLDPGDPGVQYVLMPLRV